jgi:hypothetical protein
MVDGKGDTPVPKESASWALRDIFPSNSDIIIDINNAGYPPNII